jgi:hypothetical protein
LEIGLLGYEDDWHGVRIDGLGVDRTQQSFGCREGVLPVAVGEKKRPEDGTADGAAAKKRKKKSPCRKLFDGR